MLTVIGIAVVGHDGALTAEESPLVVVDEHPAMARAPTRAIEAVGAVGESAQVRCAVLWYTWWGAVSTGRWCAANSPVGIVVAVLPWLSNDPNELRERQQVR